MATCQNCSAKLLPGQRVCKACGDPVPDEQDGSDAPDPMLGRTIAGNYEILESIGEGAMGRVYKARQVSLDKLTAIKVLHKHLAADPKVTKRFHREARAASRLSHPNSLHIIDFGEDDDGTLYIAMELLDGDDLLTVIEHDAPLTPMRIYDLMRQILSALDTAHHAGIIHRDLKPENVVVLESPGGEEHVKVCDFGIAKIQEAEGGSAITVSGFVCGTPEYMAPEQARGEQLDPRADLYAAGCMLYQMLTGKLPFTAESALGIITKHLTEIPVPPRERTPEWSVPRALERVCLKAMAKDREARYPDAASMSEALKEAVEALGPAAKKPLGSVREDPTADIELPSGGTAELPAAGGGSLGWIVGLVLLGGAAVGVAVVSRPGGEPAGDPPDTVEVHSAPDAATPEPDEPEEADAGLGTAEAPPDAGHDAGAGEAAPQPAGRRPAKGRRAERGAVQGGMQAEAGGAGESEQNGGGPTAETPRETVSPGQAAYEEGRRSFLANDVAGAIERFEEAARLMPRNAQVHKQLGRAYMRAGQVDRAAASYRRYLELSPNAPDRAIVERMIGSSSR